MTEKIRLKTPNELTLPIAFKVKTLKIPNYTSMRLECYNQEHVMYTLSSSS